MASFSLDLAKEVERSKKDRRLESKKKKALALLKLIEEKNSEDEPPAKKARKQDPSENQTAFEIIDSKTGDVPSKEKNCSDVDDKYARAKQAIRERQKAAMEKPKIFLTLDELMPKLIPPDNADGGPKSPNDTSASDDAEKPEASRLSVEQKTPPLFMMDLQHLLLFSLMKNLSSFMPRWCKLLRPAKISSVVLATLSDVSIEDFQKHPECFPFIKEQFPTYVEMVTPAQYGSSLDLDVYGVPLSISQMKKYTRRPELREKVIRLISVPQSNCTGGVESKQDAASLSAKPEESTQEASKPKKSTPEVGKLGESKDASVGEDETNVTSQTTESMEVGGAIRDIIPRTSLMLNTVQMMAEGYPVPVTTSNEKYGDFVFSKDRYSPVKPTSPLFALDCEMCLTCIRQNEVTRVSIVNEQNEIVYDQLVKPRNRIINYLTKWSGITKEMLDPVTTRIEQVQRDISQLLPSDAIFCGQSLCNDLCALKIFHPYVIDTSVIYNMSGNRRVKCGLKRLSSLFLGRAIQNSPAGHCSSEDAIATMDLVRLKLSKGLDFGDAVLGGVYFPDMRTYFLTPSSAQNVQEMFHSNNANHGHEISGTPQLGRKHVASAGKKSKKHVENRGTTVNKSIVETLAKVKSIDVDQRKVFFQQTGNMLMHSFFELLADSSFSVALIGRKELVSKYDTEPKLKVVVKETDRECCKEAVTLSQEKDLTWVDLMAFADKVAVNKMEEDQTSLAEESKSVFTKLDKRVRKLVEKLRDRTLVTIVMTGRSSRGQHYNAATFVKVT